MHSAQQPYLPVTYQLESLHCFVQLGSLGLKRLVHPLRLAQRCCDFLQVSLGNLQAGQGCEQYDAVQDIGFVGRVL